MVTALRSETRERAIARLAQKARESGVKILRDRKDGRYYATSASTVGLTHYVTAVSCDCRGFATHQKCMHHSALLVALGWADGAPEPEPTLPFGKVGAHFTNVNSGTFAFAKVDEPTPERAGFADAKPEQAKTTCQFCHGQGSTPGTELFNGRRMDIRITCWHCRGTGQLAA